MLADFYHSKAWEKFRRGVIHERTSFSTGFVYCDKCGEPIVNPYDCIAHHITELTETNYNDVNISLNPNNIQLVHHKCHNLIHEKYFSKQQKVYIIFGAPLSGKTTYVNQVKSDGDYIIDINNIWRCVSGGDTKPARLNAVVFKIRNEMLDAVKYRVGNWRNAYVIGGYPLETERERLAGDLGAETILIDTDKQTCIERANENKDLLKFIDKWFTVYRPPVESLKQP